LLLACGLGAGVIGCGSQPASVKVEPPAPRAEKKPTPASVEGEPPAPRADKKPAPAPAVVPALVKDTPKVAKTKPDPVQETDPSPPQPKDRAASLVANFLRPSEEAFAARPTGRHGPRGPQALEAPEVPPEPYRGDVLRASANLRARPVRPHPLREELPLDLALAGRLMPERVALPAEGMAKLSAPDIEQPPPLPLLAGPQTDRASLTDPTAQASQEAALAGTLPVRTAPAPFERQNVPDPFENRQAVQVRTPPPERPAPPLLFPPAPPRQLPEKGN
jgi:hypothetical protein